MASDQKNIEHFNETANNPRLWKARGDDLHTAATVLRDAAVNGMRAPDWSNLQGPTRRRSTSASSTRA